TREVKGEGRGFVGSDLTAYRTWLAAPATPGLSLRTLSTNAEASLTICPTRPALCIWIRWCRLEYKDGT
ncbi:Uncharacterized protein DBV15_12221, partial [Temnothorax longispinosus]